MSDKPFPDANCFLFDEKWCCYPVNHAVDEEFRWLPEIGNEDAILYLARFAAAYSQWLQINSVVRKEAQP